MTQLILIRHGLSVTNQAKRYTGQWNVELAPEGLEQAERTAAYVAANYKVDAIYSSDLLRTCQTVQPLANRLGLPIQTCRDLREIDVGLWQGMLFEDIKKVYPEDYARNIANPACFHFPGGEDYTALTRRAGDAVLRIAAANEGKTVVIASHGGTMRALLNRWSGHGVERLFEIAPVPNCCILCAVYENGSIRVLQQPSVAHLEASVPDSDGNAV